MFNETSYTGFEGILPGIIGGGSQIGGSVVGSILAGAGHGAIAGPIGMGIGFIGSLIANIFGAHAAKEAREDQISGAWAASGPQAIDAVMNAYHQGQISASDASSALDQIEAQFRQMSQPITKYKGQFGAYPDVNAPRPGDQCNWACGTSWDLHQQIAGLKTQLTGGGGISGLNLGGLTGDPVMLAGLALVAYLLLK